ncbi:hypothetical protein [Streptomyces sp. NPDC048196]|uniref:hypothetical protein n=1 Tax=Streptomyces sp. NPDC048196 TaxID=3154712 RepID=UPI0033D21B7E
MEADLRQHYGVRLSDLFARDAAGRPLLTWRELGTLVRQLPPDARTRVALGEEDGLWGLAEHLQAMTLDELRVANWQRANEGVKRSKQSKPPKPIARPGSKKRGKDRDSPERQAARTAALQRAAARRAAIASGEIT